MGSWKLHATRGMNSSVQMAGQMKWVHLMWCIWSYQMYKMKPPMRGQFKTRAEFEEAKGFYANRLHGMPKGKPMEASKVSPEKSGSS